MEDYEKLGVFYLGASGADGSREPVLLESSRLTTHAVCMGMTGSGKTGLCIGLLEEAAIDGIPVIAIDPKGDLGNLLLTFPGLAPADFAPWMDPADAERRGITREVLAAETAERMRQGLSDSAQDAARIGRLAQAADFAIYTPGSSAGLPLSIVRSLEAPPPALRDDDELLRERVQATVSGLLGLLGIDTDPLQSREHILVSRILAQAFARGESLSLAGVLQQVKTPPFQMLGALDLESFYPEKERMKLVLALNNLLASPAFESWLTGEPLDVQRLLYTKSGKPRVSILSIGHLSDEQRMFFVTLLLNEVLAYTRAQAGTSSLRAILYMDEVFGYFPPVAEPPSKRPLLTLLKQARAFGVGVVLATQNPVDLDYKGLSNIGTWFLGRLQTERDRARVLDGMEGAATTSGASFDRASLDGLLAGLAPRSFVLQSARGGAPRTFGTRQTLCYLRGPMTRTEIKMLMEPRKAARSVEPAATAAPTSSAAESAPTLAAGGGAPILPAEIEAVYLPRGAGPATRYLPAALAVLRVTTADAPPRTLALLAPFREGPLALDFEHAALLATPLDELAKQPDPGLAFAPLPAAASEKKRYAAWGKEALAVGCARAAVTRWKSPSTKLESEPGESERDFRARVLHAAREKRDAKVAALTAKYQTKLTTAREREAKAAAAHAREYEQASSAKLEGAVDFGSAVLSTLFGKRRGFAQDAGKAARTASRVSKEQGDVDRSAQKLADATEQRATLETELASLLAELTALPIEELLEARTVKPKKSDVQLSFLGIAFVPG